MSSQSPYQLTVVVPTYNEKDNIRPLIQKLQNTLQAIRWELVFVDDNSSDGTLDELRQMASQHSNIRFIHRIHARGLATACIEGMSSSVSPYVAVMDADMQHDEQLLPTMLQKLENGDDLVIGSRHTAGGSMGTMPAHRVLISRFAGGLSRLVMRQPVSDPMSGFFMLRRSLLHQVLPRLTTTGYKLLLDIVLCADRKTRISEVAYSMRHRQFGDSKLETQVILEYLAFLLEKSVGRYIPMRFILFSMVGASGILVHLASLGLLHRLLALDFFISQALATLVAMFSNFFLNNRITYADQRLHGGAMLRGLISFCLSCSLGAIINLMVSDYLNSIDYLWWAAGLTGALVGAVWNYAITSVFTWRRTKAR